jgi:hypothetical protein
MAVPLWHLEPGKARLKLTRVSAEVFPDAPERGLANLQANNQGLPGLNPLGVDFLESEPREPSECYVRGGDLVATYTDRPQAAMRAQIYWRAASHELADALAAVELVVSVQTSLLDSCPRVTICSQASAGAVFSLSNAERGEFVPVGQQAETRAGQLGCFLIRIENSGLSYAQMIHPRDARETTLLSASETGPQSVELRHQLFAERLEKGVILRARALGVLLERANDCAAAAFHYAAFLAEQLPLTT